jgi:hypothetical protein
VNEKANTIGENTKWPWNSRTNNEQSLTFSFSRVLMARKLISFAVCPASQPEKRSTREVIGQDPFSESAD